MPSHICSVRQRSLLFFCRASAKLLGSSLPTSGCRAHKSLWAVPGAPSGHHLCPSGLFVNSQKEPYSPRARASAACSPWSPRAGPRVHGSQIPGHVNAPGRGGRAPLAGPAAGKLRSRDASSLPSPARLGAPSSHTSAPGRRGRDRRAQLRRPRAWPWASCFMLRIHVDLGICSPVIELFVVYIFPSPLNNRVNFTLHADVSHIFSVASCPSPTPPHYCILEPSGATSLLSVNPPLWAPSIVICFKTQLSFFPETLIVLDNRVPVRSAGDTEIRTGAASVLLTLQ